MTEHELTEEKVGELFDEIHQPPPYSNWDFLSGREVSRELEFARAAYDLGKRASDLGKQDDDGFIPCEFEDIRKGDTVERTFTQATGVKATWTAVADHQGDCDGDWLTERGWMLTMRNDVDSTYRRKPVPVQPPNPDEHPIILDGSGRPFIWDGDELYKQAGVQSLGIYPKAFGNDWVSAKVVAKEDD